MKAEEEATNPTPAKRPRSEMLGSGIGKIWVTDDWDSPETNAEITDLFENKKDFD